MDEKSLLLDFVSKHGVDVDGEILYVNPNNPPGIHVWGKIDRLLKFGYTWTWDQKKKGGKDD